MASCDEMLRLSDTDYRNDYRMRLIVLPSRLSRYQSLDKNLKTGPGAALIVSPVVFMMDFQLKQLHLEEWLRTGSGINKKYFEGEEIAEIRTPKIQGHGMFPLLFPLTTC